MMAVWEFLPARGRPAATQAFVFHIRLCRLQLSIQHAEAAYPTAAHRSMIDATFFGLDFPPNNRSRGTACC